jgi:hypothetical protein
MKRDNVKDAKVDGIKLKYSLTKEERRMWTGFIYYGASGGLLRTGL